MRTSVIGVAFLCAAMFAGAPAQAEVYVGAGISNSSYSYEDLDNSSGNKIYGGYRMPNGVFFEAARVDLGDTVSKLAPLGFQASGIAGYVGYASGSGMGPDGFVKIGFYSFDTDLLVNGSTVDTQSGSGLAWGFGLLVALNETFTIRMELDGYVGVKDFADNDSVYGGSLSLEARF